MIVVMKNGAEAAQIQAISALVESWGLNRFGTETIPPILARGVLIDVAAAKVAELVSTN